MPLSGVDGSKFNMKINLYVVSLDEHNVPRVERIQTTKDTKVLNTICLYYRIFFFSLQELCCPFNFVKKKIVNYVYPLLRPGVCFSPFFKYILFNILLNMYTYPTAPKRFCSIPTCWFSFCFPFMLFYINCKGEYPGTVGKSMKDSPY
jgi:hypothetical protein